MQSKKLQRLFFFFKYYFCSPRFFFPGLGTRTGVDGRRSAFLWRFSKEVKETSSSWFSSKLFPHNWNKDGESCVEFNSRVRRVDMTEPESSERFEPETHRFRSNESHPHLTFEKTSSLFFTEITFSSILDTNLSERPSFSDQIVSFDDSILLLKFFCFDEKLKLGGEKEFCDTTTITKRSRLVRSLPRWGENWRRDSRRRQSRRRRRHRHQRRCRRRRRRKLRNRDGGKKKKERAKVFWSNQHGRAGEGGLGCPGRAADVDRRRLVVVGPCQPQPPWKTD